MRKPLWCVVDVYGVIVLATTDAGEAQAYYDRKFKEAEETNQEGLPSVPYEVEILEETGMSAKELFDLG